MKKKQKKPRKPTATTLDLIPLRQFDDSGRILTRDGTIVDIFQLMPRNLRVQNPDERDAAIYEYCVFLRGMSGDFKIIAMNYPTQTSSQRRYLERVRDRTENERYLYFLNQKLAELERIEETVSDREYYVMLFAANEQQYRKYASDLNELMGRVLTVSQIGKEKKIQILRRLGTAGSRIM